MKLKKLYTFMIALGIAPCSWSQSFTYDQLFQMLLNSQCLDNTNYRDDLLRNVRSLQPVEKVDFPKQLNADNLLPHFDTSKARYFSADFLEKVHDSTQGIYYGVIAENPKVEIIGCDHWLCSNDIHTKVSIPIHILVIYDFATDLELAKKATPFGKTKLMDSYIFKPLYFPCTIETYSN